jgi:hypothetical protein
MAFPFMDQMPADNIFMNESALQGNDIFNNADMDFNNAAVNNSLLDMPTAHESNAPLDDSFLPKDYEQFEEDRENVNPFAGPAAKRSRSDKELQAEEKRAKESARTLLRLIKSESTKVGKQKVS